MTELDVIREYQATKFYNLMESGGELGTEVTEIDSGGAFENAVADWDKPVAEAEDKPSPDDEFEPLP